MSTMQQLLAKTQVAVTELPTVTSDDNGKKLGVSGGSWQAVAAELPAVSGSDNGKVLTVSSGNWAAVTPTAELPAVTSSDEGKVLAVNGSGQWVALSLSDLATALAALSGGAE